MSRDLPIDRIVSRPGGRTIDPATVAGLADSIATVGLLNPIRVRPSSDGWELIAGAHRLAACRSLGLAEIAAEVVDSDDLRAELAMIDENLMRAELSPADRAKQTARRKELYEELHQETKHGGDHKSIKWQSLPLDPAERFTADTAATTGKSERVVRLDAERGKRVIAEVLDMVRGTHLDTGAYLDKLKRLAPNEQVQAARRDLAQDRRSRRLPPPTTTALSPEEVLRKQVDRLLSAWNAASAEAREAFLAEIDAPVMDASKWGSA